MADEVLGNVYEALTQVALEDYTKIIKKGESVFFEQKPKGINIKPDITIGANKDQPRIILQIHHTNAEMASQKKFWRNIGEFVDARIVLGSKTIIANIVFDSGQKRQLSVASDALFDGFLEADRAIYGTRLIGLGNTITASIKKEGITKTDRTSFVRHTVNTNSKVTTLVKEFANDLEKCLTRSSKLSSGWFSAFDKVQLSRPSKRVPVSRPTTLRRGLGRLLPIADEAHLRGLLLAVRANKPTSVPYYMSTLGLTQHVVSSSNHRIDDKEILGLCSAFGDDDIVNLWRSAKNRSLSLQQACNSIEHSNDYSRFHKFVVSEIGRLRTSSGMKKALNDCFNDPDFVLGQHIGLINPIKSGNWLFDYLMVAIKASTGKQQGYGYTRLGEESGFRFEIAATAGVVLSPYIQRKKNLRADILDGIAKTLAAHIDKLSTWIPAHQAEIASFFLRGLFEDKIYKIAAFDPLGELLAAALKTDDWQQHSRYPTLLTEILGAKGVATTRLISSSSALLLWQSATDKGVAHKTKELMGRLGMLRVKKGAKGNLAPNLNISKIAVLIDGTWTNQHISQLVAAGADGIFYPDELRQLKTFMK